MMENLQTHFLYPSAIYASKEPVLVHTILGSCVAVCLYDPILKWGGINHFMLPLWNGQGLASPKYGNIAIEKLIDKLKTMGSNHKSLKAKIFGGGEVIESNINQFKIGERNVRLAYDMMEEYKIPVVSASVGGQSGRKIQFYTATGEVRQRLIPKTENILREP